MKERSSVRRVVTKQQLHVRSHCNAKIHAGMRRNATQLTVPDMRSCVRSRRIRYRTTPYVVVRCIALAPKANVLDVDRPHVRLTLKIVPRRVLPCVVYKTYTARYTAHWGTVPQRNVSRIKAAFHDIDTDTDILARNRACRCRGMRP